MKNLPNIPVDICLRKLISIPPSVTKSILFWHGYGKFYPTGEINVAYVLIEHFLIYDCTPIVVSNIYKECEKYSKINSGISNRSPDSLA